MATKTVENKKEFTMVEVFALWKKKAKSGADYFTGRSVEGINLRGFFNTNKKNPKEPDLRVYTVYKDGELSEKPIISMWCNVSKNQNKFLTGVINEKRVVGFIRKTDNDKAPYVTVYFSDDKQPEQPAEEPKKATKKETAKAPF